MSFLIAVPEYMTAAASDLVNIGSTVVRANAAALAPTSGVIAAGADEVSVAISAMFASQAQAYQTVSAQAASFHQQFLASLNAGAGHNGRGGQCLAFADG